ncbi:CPBP family intramembrane glutamic endopeptidase [Marinilabilia sp.]|jgi:membrane protease YdiL (CAAX protease family)
MKRAWERLPQKRIQIINHASSIRPITFTNYLLMKTHGISPGIIRAYKSPLTFYTLSLFIPWGFWFLSGYISHLTPYTGFLQWLVGILSFAGLLAPVLIALGFIWPDRHLRDDLLGRVFNFHRIKPQYLLVTAFLMLVSILLAQAISLFFGYSAEQFQFRGGYTFSSGIFPVWFMLVAAPLLEELAWHSYGTDCLRSRYNLLTASIGFAVFWAFWHFPLSFIKDYYHSNLVEEGALYSLNFVVSLIPFVIIINWLYYKTERNILLPVIFHISAGFFNEIFATHPISKVIQTGLLLIFSVFLVLSNKELFFHRLAISSQNIKSI